jgi:hypothetical protein
MYFFNIQHYELEVYQRNIFDRDEVNPTAAAPPLELAHIKIA